MITLDDALNRNYYFYSGSGDVRTDFLRQVNDAFLGYDFNSFIGDKASYWMRQGMSRSDAFTKAYHQGVEMAIRACEAIPKYRKEIIKKFNENPGLRGGISDVTVNHMKYTELSTLRTNLGLSRRGKKVTKQETAPKKTVEKAKEALKQEPVQETAKKVIVNEQLSFMDMLKPHHEIEEFYTVEEAMKAYPGYSYDELVKVGVHITDPDGREKLEKYGMIEQILQYDITIEGVELTREALLACNKDDLLEIYDVVRKLNRIVNKGRTK